MRLIDKLKSIVVRNKILFAPFKYRIDKQTKKRQQILNTQGYEINEKVYQALKGDISYFAWAGTMLGVVRDKGFIPHDDDIDYGIIINNNSDWKLLKDRLDNNDTGMKMVYFFTYNDVIDVVSFECQGIILDFNRLHINDDGTCYIQFYHRNYKYYYENQQYSTIRAAQKYDSTLDTVEINNSHFYIPANYEDYLITMYGEQWKTPIKGVKEDAVVGTRELRDYDYAIMHKPEEFNQFL